MSAARRADAQKASDAFMASWRKLPFQNLGRKSAGLSRNFFPDAGEQAFAYAKACGIIGKSFIGKRISALGKPRSINELDRLIFPETLRELPGRELLVDLERRILQRTTRQLFAVIDSYSNPPELLVRQLRACEYADLKTCLHHISAGKAAPQTLSDIGRFRTIRFGAFPDLGAMLNGTEFEFILAKSLKALKSADLNLVPIEAELDLHYYTLLIQSMRHLSASDRLLAGQITAEEISLRNCIWALRLCVYFQKTPEEAAKYLMELKMPGEEMSLAADAHFLLRLPFDDRSAWKKWRWEKLLPPRNVGENWAVNPRYFQNAVFQYIYRLSLRGFRRMPFSMSSIFCYIKLKQFEEDLLTSIAEGLGLGMAGNDVFQLLEVPS